jgi:hypothetical protein
MKKYMLSLLFMGGTIICLAQTPLGISYQAILRNSEGTIRANETIALQIGIIDDQGNSFYSEIHNTTTNNFGLANVVIGQGTTSDDLSAVDWSAGPYFLEIAVNGNTMGTNQLLSVPYAFYSRKALEVENGDNWGSQEIISNGSLDGNGTVSDPLKLAQQGSISGQVLKWNGTSWLPGQDDSGNSLWQKNGDNIHYNTGSVGMGTENPQADLHVNGTDGMLVQGEYGSGGTQIVL